MRHITVKQPFFLASFRLLLHDVANRLKVADYHNYGTKCNHAKFRCPRFRYAPRFKPSYNCTTAALDLLKVINIKLNGRGKVRIKHSLFCGDEIITDTPYHLFHNQCRTTEDGVYSVTTQTRYNAEGTALNSTQKQLISQLSSSIESKSISINERNLTSTQWTAYNIGTKRTAYSNIPISTITAETVTVDGIVVSRKDNIGILSTVTRAYSALGMIITLTDGRGNATTTHTDIAGRAIRVTDALDNGTDTSYCTCCDHPSTITDALPL